MIKLISSDMDGTLLDSYRQITPINVEAIKRAQENGINFIINTGGATADNIIDLINLVKKTIKKNYGIDLITEQEIVKWDSNAKEN